MKNLNWFQGRDLAISENRAIRREAWRKWLVFGPALRFISKIVDDVEQRYVVPNLEFGRDEFLANDWTDEPWVDGTVPTGVTPPGPPYQPGPGGGTGGSGSGGSGSFGPPPSGGGGSGGGGGGGGSGGGGDHYCPGGYHLSADGLHCEKDNAPDKSATVSVSIPQPDLSAVGAFDGGRNCFLQSGGGGPYTVTLYVSVSISGGPPGVGTLSVVLQGATQLGTGWPGMNQDFEFSGVSFQPGSAITATVTYNIAGKTFSGSGSVSFPGICPKRGCTNPSASNYDPQAQEDDGSCVYCPSGTHWNGTACVPDDDDHSSNGSVGGSQM